MDKDLLKMATEIVINRRGEVEEVIKEIESIYGFLSKGSKKQEVEEIPSELELLRQNPEKSIRNKDIICLECGESMVVLSPHLIRRHGMTAREYKEKYGIKKGIPLCARSYSKKRKDMMKDRVEMLVQKMTEGRKKKKKKTTTTTTTATTTATATT